MSYLRITNNPIGYGQHKSNIFSHVTKLFISKTKFRTMTEGSKKMYIIYQSTYSNYYFCTKKCSQPHETNFM